MSIEVWHPILSLHEMTTDAAPPVPPLPRPLDGRVNVRLLITDSTGAVAGMDAGNVSEEVSKAVIHMLIRDHAADTKNIIATDDDDDGDPR